MKLIQMNAEPSILPESPPVVLCLSGHDPSGGAGIQADIEAVRAMGAHPMTVVTALTAQDSRNVYRVFPQSSKAFREQLEVILGDFSLSGVKLGLVGSASIAEEILRFLEQIPGVSVVMDPVLAAGGGLALADELSLELVRTAFLPRVNWLTPNAPELLRLAAEDAVDAAALSLIQRGVKNVLVTGTHLDEQDVVNRWYSQGAIRTWHWPRLPFEFHGSGCTLAAALAAALALGYPEFKALELAQAYTHSVLKKAYRLGAGQWFPGRNGFER